MKDTQVFEKARSFVYRNARPLDFAIWKHLFEGGDSRDIVHILSFYQNDDGGFAYGIEPDFLNEHSSPIGTWQATVILNRIGATGDEDIVKGILAYLDSGDSFGGGKWFNTIATNNDYPHAIWWEHRGDCPSDNPTASLVGFALKHATPDSPLYKKCATIAKSCVQEFIAAPTDEMHILRCYMELYRYCRELDGFDLFDIDQFKNALFSAVKAAVCTDTGKWSTEYVCKPSQFFDGSDLIFDIFGRDLCIKEGELLLRTQLDDGSYPLAWTWCNDYPEFFVAANYWKSIILCNNMLYLKTLNLI